MPVKFHPLPALCKQLPFVWPLPQPMGAHLHGQLLRGYLECGLEGEMHGPPSLLPHETPFQLPEKGPNEVSNLRSLGLRPLLPRSKGDIVLNHLRR